MIATKADMAMTMSVNFQACCRVGHVTLRNSRYDSADEAREGIAHHPGWDRRCARRCRAAGAPRAYRALAAAAYRFVTISSSASARPRRRAHLASSPSSASSSAAISSISSSLALVWRAATRARAAAPLSPLVVLCQVKLSPTRACGRIAGASCSRRTHEGRLLRLAMRPLLPAARTILVRSSMRSGSFFLFLVVI